MNTAPVLSIKVQKLTHFYTFYCYRWFLHCMYCIQCISTLNAIRIERNPWALGSTVNPKRNAFKNLNWRNFQLNMLLFTLKSNTMFNPHLIQRSNNSHYQTSCGSFIICSNTEKTFLPRQGSKPGPQNTKRPRYHRATTPPTIKTF